MALDGASINTTAPPPANLESAEAAGLVYVSDEDPGIRRRRAAKGFRYVGPEGTPVRDEATLARIRKLAIPPAYEDVWICPDPNGHIQATGRDARGRKQYRYHERWRSVRDETKYARMAAFGRALPKIRERIDTDLRRHGLPKEKVVAAVVRLLELTFMRVGNDEYAKTNKHFGLTTLRDRHARFHGAEVELVFKGKSGVEHRTSVHDRRLARIVKSCQDIPGQRLFQYYDEAGERRPVGSSDVNAYLREISGEDFTAKDFRTWAGTLAAAKALALQPPPTNEREAKQAVTLCVKATAGLLGNTPAVCRAAYIHPEVLKAFGDGKLPARFAEAEGDEYEAEVLAFLDALSAELQRETGLTPEEQVDASTA
jgi:DNA topoisomerase-1